MSYEKIYEMFLTINDLILCMCDNGVLLDEHAINIPLDNVANLIGESHRFTLHMPNNRSTEYFLDVYMPRYPNYQAPSFQLTVVEGDPRDKSSWQILADLGWCYINLLDEMLLNDWWNSHSFFHGSSRDELFYYDIPIGML